MEGNPVSKESSYRMCILAYFSELAYLDYSMVTRAEVVTAREQYQDELLDVEEKENLQEEKNSSELAAIRHTQKLADANRTVVQIRFDDMFADIGILKLKHFQGKQYYEFVSKRSRIRLGCVSTGRVGKISTKENRRKAIRIRTASVTSEICQRVY